MNIKAILKVINIKNVNKLPLHNANDTLLSKLTITASNMTWIIVLKKYFYTLISYNIKEII